MKWLLIIILCALSCFVFSSCGGQGNSRYKSAEVDENDVVSDPPLEPRQHDKFQITGIIETCRHCKGYGIVQDGLYGTARFCMFCGGNRVVDAAINQLPDDFFSNMEGGSSSEEDNNSLYRAQIEAEKEMHERNLESLERQLEYIEGSVNRAYLDQQIINERYEIQRLRNMLNNLN